MAIRIREARWRSERGAELIEFAIVAPLLILLMAGIFDFGMMFRTYEIVTNAAREGARVAVLPGYANPADIQSRVDQYLSAAGLASAPATVTDVTVTTGAGTFNAKSVNVVYTYPFVVLGPIGAFFGGTFGSIQLQATSVMRAESQSP